MKSLIFLLCAGMMESISGFLLTMLAGEYFSGQFHDGTKHQLLNRIGLVINHEHLISWFFICLAIKITSGFLFKSWSHVLTDSILSYQIDHSSIGLLANSSLKNLIRKGVFEAIRDLIFLSTGLVMLSFISIPIFLITMIVFVLLMVVQFGIGRMQAKVYIRYKKENRRLRETKEVRQRHVLLEHSSNYAWHRSMLNAISASGVFLSIGFSLWVMDIHWIPVNFSEGLMSFLVLLQLQGTMRRLLGLPVYYFKGWKSLKKSGLISKFGTRSIQTLTSIWLLVILLMTFS